MPAGGFVAVVISANYTAKVTVSSVITAITRRASIITLEEGIDYDQVFSAALRHSTLPKPIFRSMVPSGI